jgi:hypothetical protein
MPERLLLMFEWLGVRQHNCATNWARASREMEWRLRINFVVTMRAELNIFEKNT